MPKRKNPFSPKAEAQLIKQAAKDRGDEYYYTGFPCRRGHYDKRSVKAGVCPSCDKIAKAKYNAKAGSKEKGRLATRRWVSNNLDRVAAKVSEARARKLKATPSWLTSEDRSVIYSMHKMAGRLTKCMGISHHVDHVVPLQGETVTGLHVPWNLRVIPAYQNHKKKNILMPELIAA